MNKRNFLKAVGIGAVAVAAPALASSASSGMYLAGSPEVAMAYSKAEYPHFDPKKSYGWFFKTSDPIDQAVFEHAKETLQPSICEAIPPSYRNMVTFEAFEDLGTNPGETFNSVFWRYRGRHP